MRLRVTGSLLMVVILFLLPLLTCAFQIEEGVIDEVRGEVRVISFEEQERPARAGEFVMSGEAIETGPDGFARVVMADGSVMEIREDSRVEVFDSRIYQKASHGLALFMGRMWAAVVGEEERELEMEVVTPTAVAGVRGTSFTTGVGKDGATRVGVDEGVVSVSSEAGGEVKIKAGEETTVEWEGPPSPAAAYRTGEQNWREWILERQDKIVKHGRLIVPLIMKDVKKSRRKMWRMKNKGDRIIKRLKNQAERQKRMGKEVKLSDTQKKQVEQYIKDLLEALFELYVNDEKMMIKYYLLKQVQTDAKQNPDLYSPELIEVVDQALQDLEKQEIHKIHKQNREVIAAYLTAMDEFAKQHKLGRYQEGTELKDHQQELIEARKKYREAAP